MKKNISLCVWLLAMSAPLRAETLLCLMEPDDVVDLGSPVTGVLDEVGVERGDLVRKGQVVAKLVSRVEQQAVEVAKFRAKKAAELTSAGAAKSYAQREKQRAEMLVQKNFVSKQFLDQAATDESVATQKLAQAEENRRQAELELKLAQAQLDLRIIRSPVSGVVMERYLSPGHRVEQEPIVKIAKVDVLRVEVIVPAKFFNQIKPGMSASVTPELPGAGSYTAKVTVVDQVIDAASNSFRVRMALPNPGQLLPVGARCKADILPAGSAEAAKYPAMTMPKPGAPGVQKNLSAPLPKPVSSVPKEATVAPSEVKKPAPAAAPKSGALPQADAPVAGAISSLPEAANAEVIQAVEAWARAWSARDADGHLAAYAEDFHSSDGQNLDAWIKKRREKMQLVKFIDVRVVSPQVTFEAENRAKVTFTQIYRSDKFNGQTSKTLLLAKANGRWLIVREAL